MTTADPRGRRALVLIAGGTGTLGTQVVPLLTARGLAVRILTRDPARARPLQDDHVEVVAGDVRDRTAVDRAMAGVRTVISAIQGFSGTGGATPRTVDGQGNSTLIQAARAAGVDHFILVSVQGAAPHHPLELFRMKHQAEQELQASGLTWTIIRPTAFMEVWTRLIGEPLVTTGRTRIFGRGDTPINFVSAHDVARFVDLAVVDPTLRGVLVEVGGPENLTFTQVVQIVETVTRQTGVTRHVPLPLMRLLAVLLRPVNPPFARQIQAAVVMATRDMSFDPTDTGRRYPSISLTRMAAMVRRDFGG